jgi:hypothetical protein
MAFEVKGFGTPDYGINAIAGNPINLPSGMSKLNEILDYQGKNLELQKKTELQPYAIEAGKAEAKKAIVGAEKSQLDLANEKMDRIRQSQVANITDPIVAKAAEDPDFAKQPETIKHMKMLIDRQAQIAFDSGIDRKTIDQQIAPYHQIVEQNPQQYRQFQISRMLSGLDTQTQAKMNQLTTVGGQPAIFNPAQGSVTPAQFPNQAPEQTSGVLAQTVSGGQPSGVTPSQMEMAPLKYRVRTAGQPYALDPTEVADRDAGNAYRNSLISNQTNLSTMRRNIDEVIKEATNLEKSQTFTAGKPGDIQRGLEVFFGTETGQKYKQLSKDLANAQISAIKASGGNLETDAGKQLVRAANGDETFPPKVLINIARRTQADMTNLDMQATAAQKFATKFGDQNMNTFKQMWSANADSKIFELKNIYDDANLNEKEKNAARDKLLGNNPAILEKFKKKWTNIEKLEKYGSL